MKNAFLSIMGTAAMLVYASNATAFSVDLNVVNTNVPVHTYATVDGTATANSFTFTITPVSGVQLMQFYFNTDLALAESQFSLPTGWAFVANPPVSANGFGLYDFSVADGWSNSLQFTITGLTSPTEANFFFLSDLPAGNGQGHFAAHIRGAAEFLGETYYVRDGGDPVPLPGTLLLLGGGVMGLAGFKRRSKKE